MTRTAATHVGDATLEPNELHSSSRHNGNRRNGHSPRRRNGHGTERERLSARERLLAAAQTALADSGYEGVTVNALCKQAGLSRQTFYAHFPDKRACLVAACDPELAGIDARIRSAATTERPWAASLADALELALADLHRSPSTPRERIIAAVIRLAGNREEVAAGLDEEIGLAELTAAAGVTRTTFYRHFSDRRACLAAAHTTLLDRIEARLAAATAEARGAGRVHTGLEALCDLLAAEPATARIVLVDAGRLRPPVPSGPSAGDPRRLAEVLDHALLADLPEASHDARRFAAGGVVSILRSQFVAESPGGDLRALAHDLATVALTSSAGAPAPAHSTTTPGKDQTA